MVFLVNPNEEVSGFVMEDSSGIGPVATTSGREKECGIRLLEEVTSSSKCFFFSMGHSLRLWSVRSGASKGEVVSL
jgi:hypothetical protein